MRSSVRYFPGGNLRQTDSPSSSRQFVRRRCNLSRVLVANVAGIEPFNARIRTESHEKLIQLTRVMHFPLHTSLSTTRIYGFPERLSRTILPYHLARSLPSVLPCGNALVFPHARCRRLSGSLAHALLLAANLRNVRHRTDLKDRF
jgi:hypothetical protein